LTIATIRLLHKMKGAKERVEPKTIHTTDVDAFATLPHKCC